jgi:hypothetical protein
MSVNESIDYAVLADALALVHGAYVLFVVLGQGVIMLGWFAGWGWTRNPWFRWLHLGAIGLVLLEVVFGVYCPLTLIEAQWRRLAGQAEYGETFIGHWVSEFLYFPVPLWQMHVLYVLFGILVIGTFLKYPPRRRRR